MLKHNTGNEKKTIIELMIIKYYNTLEVLLPLLTIKSRYFVDYWEFLNVWMKLVLQEEQVRTWYYQKFESQPVESGARIQEVHMSKMDLPNRLSTQKKIPTIKI